MGELTSDQRLELYRFLRTNRTLEESWPACTARGRSSEGSTDRWVRRRLP